MTAALAITLCSAVAASAQDPEPQKTEQDRYSVSQLGLNFDVPESPAFTVLDLNPQNVTRSATPRDFAASVINGLDRNGNFQSGLALELNPWGITNRNFFADGNEIPVSGEDGNGYADGNFTLVNPHGGTRFMRNLIYRTSVSFATTKGAQSDDDALRLAAGVRATPWDPGDSRLLMGRCLIAKVRSFRGMIDLVADPNYKADLHALSSTLTSKGLDDSSDEVSKAEAALGAVDLGVVKTSDLFAIAKRVEKYLAVEDRGNSAKEIREDLRKAIDEVNEPLSKPRVARVTGPIDDFVRTLDASAAKREDEKETEDLVEDKADADTPQEMFRKAVGILDQPAEKEAPESASLDAGAKKAADYIVAECKKSEEGRWNGSSWDLSFAPSWISKDGNTSSLKWNGGGIWSSLSIGSDIVGLFPGRQVGDTLNNGENRYAQVILHGRYRFGERVKDETTMMTDNGTETTVDKRVDQDTWLVGARLRLLFPGTILLQPGVGVSFEGSISNTDVSGKAAKLKDDTYYRFAAVPTLRIAENVWIDVAFGTETGRKTGNEAFVLSSIKYGYGQEPFPSLGSGSGN